MARPDREDLRWWFPIAGLCVLIACGGRSSRTEPRRCAAEHDLGQAEEAFVQANCDMLVRCGFYADASSCLESGERLPPFFDLARSGCVAVDVGELLRCADQLRAADCRTEAYFSATDICLAAIQGTLDAGADCAHDFECVSGACETTPCGDACCMGTCASRDLPEGSRCGSDADCVPGTYCAGQTNLCTRLLPAGAPCRAARECEENLGCHSGVCRPSAAEGEACEPEVFACDVFRDHCDQALSRCVPSSLLGESCAGPALGGECVPTAWCSAGSCRPLPGLGQPCVDGRCLGSFVCDRESMLCGPPNAPRQGCPT